MELTTERLNLRFWKQEDFPVYEAYYADAATARFVGGVKSSAEAWRHLASVIGHWTLRGFGQWAVEEKSTNKLVGCIGLIKPEGWPELEVGYWLVPEAQGKGFASEAVIAARDYAFKQLGAETLVSYIDPANEPSKKLAERLGAQNEKTIELLDCGPHCVYRHPAP